MTYHYSYNGFGMICFANFITRLVNPNKRFNLVSESDMLSL